MSKQQFYVVGGEYADTSFTEPAPGTELERRGPYPEREAKAIWRELTGKTVDNAMVRYFLKPAEEQNEKIYWVVGGEYADSSFTRLAPGKQLEVFGPFEKWEGLGFWRALTSRSVDDAMVRYDIRKNYNPNGDSPDAPKIPTGPVTKTVDIKLAEGKGASLSLTRPGVLNADESKKLIAELEAALMKLKAQLQA
ncbi:MAG: DUF4170 domain-containing protein [Rhodospirillaceae bacterium]|nr:DUF4170 domain-containing protein [Rhodospirillaceae bacterium]